VPFLGAGILDLVVCAQLGERTLLVLSGTKDQSNAGDRDRTLLRDCHFMFVYDAGRAIGAERPEALAYIALEFFERRDLFLVSRESCKAFPSVGNGNFAMVRPAPIEDMLGMSGRDAKRPKNR
jgi:hypothetical protein